MNRKLILRLCGKAYQVFYVLDLLAKYYGTQTLGEIENGMKA